MAPQLSTVLDTTYRTFQNIPRSTGGSIWHHGLTARDEADGNLPLLTVLELQNHNATFPNGTSQGGETNPPDTPPFYTGLNGVNLILDTKLVKAMWMIIVFSIVTVFVLRISQLFFHYIRNIYSMTRTPAQQKYYTMDHFYIWPWLKRHVIYAPLLKKRHNREFQMSSVVNYGTLPGRIHFVLLILYALANMVFCLLLDWRTPQKGALYAELRGRSGILATVNLIPLVVLASRNNIAIRILQVSFDTFNLFHRWIGRIIAIEATIHFFAWMAAYIDAKGKEATPMIFNHNPFLQYGLTGLIAMVILPFHSFSVIRHAFYETFLHLHQFLAFVALFGVYVHLSTKKLPAFPSIQVAVLLVIHERVWRLFRLFRLNVSRKGGLTSAYVEALPGEACRVTFQLPRHVAIRPGSHVYAYIPAISLWMSHPFSVAWTNVESEPPVGNSPRQTDSMSPDELERGSIRQTYQPSKAPTSVSLIIVARTGMTRQLYNAARQSPDGTFRLRGFLEGPYAGHDSLVSYGTVVMFAGGGGITHHLIQIRHLLAGAQAQTVATRKIVLVWSIRDVDAMEWVKPWMTEILRMEGRREILQILVYVSKPTQPINEKRAKKTMAVIKGRVDPGAVLDEMIPNRVGAVVVSVCGPGALADEVRAAVRSRIHVASMDMNEESFTW